MAKEITNTEDMIDSREIMERIEELEERNKPRFVAGWNMPGYMPDMETVEFDDADVALEFIKNAINDLDDEQERHKGNVEFAANLQADENGELGVNFGNMHYFISKDTDGENYLDVEERAELEALKALTSEAEGCADWEYGEALIRYSYFKNYAEELFDDCYASEIPENLRSYIDYEAFARDLKFDYTSVDFGGVEYLIRS